jgi:glyoxylase-like metal-dependent hydrolase (beta-lactamase superfamily II)/ferredoxin
MAHSERAVAENVPGDFFVDDTCIDCDTCRQVAPLTFADAGDHSYVRVQPHDEDDVRRALRAVLCCPTASIGTRERHKTADVVADFPLSIGDGVYACGFNAESSFGAHSYFVVRPDGNWLIDSPRYIPPLSKRFAELGGIANIFLSHADDIADSARYAREFSSRRIIHSGDASAVPDAECVIEGTAESQPAPGITMIPTPGHTRGSACLLVDDRYLFTGDHLWWNRERTALSASRTYCWYSWDEQIASMRRLLKHTFAWILPGHGERIQLAPSECELHLRRLLERMENERVR